MKSVIMAGGEGTRLRPLTCNIPKPMVPMVNKPVMEHIIELLKKHSLTDIAVTLQYMPNKIKNYFNDGREYGVNLKYYIEDKPMGTAGSVKNAEDFLDDTFIVISGDALTDIDLSKAIDFHFSKKSMATLVLKKVEIPLEYGVVVTDEEGRITRFLEKPSWGEVFSDTVNTGIYILSPEVLKYYNKDEIFDFSKDLFPLLLKDNKPMYGYVSEEYWCDIGDLNAYSQAHKDVLEKRVNVSIPGNEIENGVWAGEDCSIEDNVIIEAPCVIGANTKIKKGAVLGSFTVLGENNIVGERSGIKRSVIWKNSVLESNIQLRGAVVCDKVNLKENVSSFENSVIGDGTVVKENAIIKPNIKIWPDKIVEEETEVNSNLVWGSKFIRSIFGFRGMAGEINVDITPEYASKLGAAYGSIFKGKGRVAVSSDNSNPAKMLKISFVAGLVSAGLKVLDFGTMHLPVIRSAVRFYGADGGIHIGTSSRNVGRLQIDFIDKNGSNIERGTERKIETMFQREDFSRCEGSSIKDVEVIPDYTKFYLRSIVNNVRSEKLNYKIALNSSSESILNSVTELLTGLGCSIEKVNININYGNKEMNINNREYFAKMVSMGDFDLGVSIEDTSEKMMLVDNAGRIVTDDMFTALISLIMFRNIDGGTVVVPISTSHVIEQLADKNNGKVVRTKTSHQDLMNKILASDIKEQVYDQFILNFDAIAGIVKILDFMKENNYMLSDLVDMIPDFHINEREVECSWNSKGKVIRQIIQENENESIETLEGVKIFKDGGWVLVLPDAEQPLCKIKSESFSAEFAEELTNQYVNKVREINKS
ncbi:mannose-1-phosphate guanyltransferase [Herbivorax sp. ANBcel31]|uniref:mannose-1-phosphate guanyltransferase n=1 Tax=Herbivorax sp. ANBcel31 TaxID=3069754 RepID=UPI0027B7FA52|nr:mannose-1-phosphate guanyltransferase [Herbivorax sp. ANBcel31]MDQ2085972.1 mannose-1-phosphate guanyltransferase [Herbivorax sp. ANBcel31]